MSRISGKNSNVEGLDSLIVLDEAAHILNCCTKTVRRRMREAGLAVKRGFGRKTAIWRSDLQTLILRHKKGGQ